VHKIRRWNHEWIYGHFSDSWTNDNIIHKVSYELLNKAKELAHTLNVPLNCLLIGNDGIAAEELNYRGADTVYYIKSEFFSNPEEYLYKTKYCRIYKWKQTRNNTYRSN